MTLILFLPFKDGGILMSDKQDTYQEQMGMNKRTVTKLFLISEDGPAIGAAGSTQFFQTIFEELRNRNDVNNSNIIDILENELLPGIFEKAVKTYGNTITLNDVHLLIVTYNDGRIVANKMQGLLKTRIESNRGDCIGIGETAIGTLLAVETNDYPEEQILDWGRKIIQHVALQNYMVGPPEYHGVDAITIYLNGNFEMKTIKPTIERIPIPPHAKSERRTREVDKNGI